MVSPNKGLVPYEFRYHPPPLGFRNLALNRMKFPVSLLCHPGWRRLQPSTELCRRRTLQGLKHFRFHRRGTRRYPFRVCAWSEGRKLGTNVACSIIPCNVRCLQQFGKPLGSASVETVHRAHLLSCFSALGPCFRVASKGFCIFTLSRF